MGYTPTLLSQHYRGIEAYLTFGLNSFLLALLLRDFNFLSRGEAALTSVRHPSFSVISSSQNLVLFVALAKEIVPPTNHKGLELSLQDALLKLTLERGDLSSNFPFLPKPGGLCPGVLTRINLRAEKS